MVEKNGGGRHGVCFYKVNGLKTSLIVLIVSDLYDEAKLCSYMAVVTSIVMETDPQITCSWELVSCDLNELFVFYVINCYCFVICPKYLTLNILESSHRK